MSEKDRLKREWEARAQSPLRDFFVASHAGWDDPEVWRRHSAVDVRLMLTGIPEAKLPSMHVLEIGCGTGRLAEGMATRAASYAGIDVAPTMVETARSRCAHVPNARFALCDGESIPGEFRASRYDLVFAHAVFIHVPTEIFLAYVAAAAPLLAEGGQLRFQVRADPEDDERLPPGALAASAALFVEDAATNHAIAAPESALANAPGYLGPQYKASELAAAVRPFVRNGFDVYRFDPMFLYGVLT